MVTGQFYISILKIYSDDKISSLSLRSDIAKEEKPDILIVTYGRIVLEAIKAKEELENRGKKCGIVLLEKLKPYEETAKNLLPYMPKEGGLLLFLEEEIREGGCGMMLTDALAEIRALDSHKHKILAPHDSFVIPSKNETVFDAAGISAPCIVRACLEIL